MMNEEVTVTPSLDLDSKVISVIDQLTTKLDNVEVKVKDNHFNLKKSVMDLSEEVTGPGDDEHTGTTSGKRVKEEVPQLVSESTPIKRRRRNFDFSGLKKKKNPKGKQYFVEEIQGKHVSADGKVISYWIKWEKYSSKSNTWEPKDHIPQFIVDEFEHEFAKKRMMNLRTLFSAEVGQLPLGETAHIRIPTALGGTQYAEVKAICNADMNFDDKRVKKIHGVADTENGTRYFLVEFEDETTFVIEAEVMKWTYPQEVIRFYQSKIRWE